MIKSTAIIGMGALGLLYADQITRTQGRDAVTFVCDEERLKRYRSIPVTVNGEKRDFNMADYRSVSPFDLVIVAVKYTGLQTALQTMKNCVDKNTIIISVMNGVDSEQIIGKSFGMEHMLYSVAQGMDAMRTGHDLRFSKAGELHIGVTKSSQKENFESLKEFFDCAGVPYVVEEDIIYRMWCKYMLNIGINQVCHAFQTDYAGALQKDSEAYHVLVDAMKEVVTLAQAERINLTEADIGYDIKVIQTLAPHAYPSMRQDGVAKRPSEVEMFAGTLIRMSQVHNIKAPANQYLYRKIKELEHSYNV